VAIGHRPNGRGTHRENGWSSGRALRPLHLLPILERDLTCSWRGTRCAAQSRRRNRTINVWNVRREWTIQIVRVHRYACALGVKPWSSELTMRPGERFRTRQVMFTGVRLGAYS